MTTLAASIAPGETSPSMASRAPVHISAVWMARRRNLAKACSDAFFSCSAIAAIWAAVCMPHQRSSTMSPMPRPRTTSPFLSAWAASPCASLVSLALALWSAAVR